MKKLCMIIFCIYSFGLSCFAVEAPCGIGPEAEKIVTLAKSELGIYSGVVTPFVTRILDSGGMDIASTDTTLDQLTAQAKKDGYNLGNVVANLKRFNRLVVNCKEYPEYLKRKKVERELIAKDKELKSQADSARLKKKKEEEKLVKTELGNENKSQFQGKLHTTTEKPKLSEETKIGNPGEIANEKTGAIGGAVESVESDQLLEGSPQPIRITSVQKPRLIKNVKPIYPQIALKDRIQGVIILETTIDIYGRVSQARVISGHPLLNDAALNAIKQWVYEPYILNGIPKPVIFTATITFKLQSK